MFPVATLTVIWPSRPTVNGRRPDTRGLVAHRLIADTIQTRAAATTVAIFEISSVVQNKTPGRRPQFRGSPPRGQGCPGEGGAPVAWQPEPEAVPWTCVMRRPVSGPGPVSMCVPEATDHRLVV